VADAVRYNERTVAERSNARLKDRRSLRPGPSSSLALSADQLMRLRQ
jgi:hypothetical protein